MGLVTQIYSDEESCHRLDCSGIGERAPIDETASRNNFYQWSQSLLGIFVVTADDNVAIEIMLQSSQRRRAGIVKCGDGVDPRWSQLGALLGRRAGPDTEHTSRFTSDCRFQRHRDIDDQCSRLDPRANLFENSDLRFKWNCQYEN